MKKKKLIKFGTSDIVAAFFGAIVFFLMHHLLCIDSGVTGTTLHSAYGFGTAFSSVFGPVVGGVLAFVGAAVSDAIRYGGDVAWSWVVASAIHCFGAGLCKYKINVRIGWCEREDVIIFNFYQALSAVIGWFIVAPLWDMIFNYESAGYAFSQGVKMGLFNILTTALIGSLFLWLTAKYARRQLEERRRGDDM